MAARATTEKFHTTRSWFLSTLSSARNAIGHRRLVFDRHRFTVGVDRLHQDATARQGLALQLEFVIVVGLTATRSPAVSGVAGNSFELLRRVTRRPGDTSCW